MPKGKISLQLAQEVSKKGVATIIEIIRNGKTIAEIYPTDDGIKIKSRCLVRVSAKGGKAWTAFNYDPRTSPTDINIEIGIVVKRK